MPPVESGVSTPDSWLAEVRRYYDRNTPAFVAYGQGRRVGAIHRAVWGPGVTGMDEAFHYIEAQIARTLTERLAGIRTPHVLDLGCGVGASILYLAGRLPLKGTAITISPVQARMATRRTEDAGLSGRVQVLEADFGRLPASVVAVDAAYAIEAFVHAPDASAFFSESARVINPGGLLIICDDVERPSTDSAAHRAIARFKRGWKVNTLVTSDQLRGLAAAAGFDLESVTDLTPYLDLHRIRDRVVDAALAVLDWLPLERTRFGHLVGGRALQECLSRGWVGYELAVFRRRSARKA